MGAAARFVRHRSTVRASQIVIGVVLVIASLAKIQDLEAFSGQVHNFRLAPVWSENLIAMTLPWVEFVAGLALLVGIRGRAAGFVATALMTVFTLGVVAAMARGLDFECGCFGKADSSRVGAAKLLQNLFFVLLSVGASIRPSR